MKIIASKHPQFPNGSVWCASMGKRKVVVSLPLIEVSLGITPSANAFRQAFNDTSKPGDKIVADNVEVEIK